MTRVFTVCLLAAAAAGCSKDPPKSDAPPPPKAADVFDKGTGPPKGKKAGPGFD